MVKTKCAEGYFCFEKVNVVLLVAVVIIISIYIVRDYRRLLRIIKKKGHQVVSTIKEIQIPSSRLINIPTRGAPPQYEQIGTLHEIDSPQEKRPMVLPLFGRRLYSSSHKWKYYTMTDQNNMVKLPIQNVRRANCMQDVGCEELYDDDNIFLDAYSGEFRVKLYIPQYPRYIPL